MTIGGILLLALLAIGYVTPGGIALLRHHHNAAAILALNLFLGWSGLGWIIALVWALTAVRPELAERRGERRSPVAAAPGVKLAPGARPLPAEDLTRS